MISMARSNSNTFMSNRKWIRLPTALLAGGLIVSCEEAQVESYKNEDSFTRKSKITTDCFPQHIE